VTPDPLSEVIFPASQERYAPMRTPEGKMTLHLDLVSDGQEHSGTTEYSMAFRPNQSNGQIAAMWPMGICISQGHGSR
jgi:hypothetical protein